MRQADLGGAGLYRRDIDGLRALAVMAVVLFHINAHWLPGGFVGVDVFFVISGYLITRNIVTDLDGARFTLAEFYLRRIKRIVPVMLTVLAFTLLAGYFVLLPEDLEALAKSAVWSVASLANVYFWREVNTDYFATESAQLPLLHLWSLGVEEQFYLFWPLLLAGIWRLWPRTVSGRNAALRPALILALLLVPLSVVFAEWYFEASPRFVYYMLPSRAGELMVGAAAALWSMGSRPDSITWVRSTVMNWMGLSLLLLSLLFLNETQVFPGWRSLLPTVGAALLLLAGLGAQGTWLQRALSFAPMVWIGRLSYSLYLWHWPVLAYWRYLYGQPGALEGMGLLALMFVLSWCSHRWVEEPARHVRYGAARVLMGQFVLPGGALLLFALFLVLGPRLGLPAHSQQYLLALQERRADLQAAYQQDWVCQRQRLHDADLKNDRCVLGKATERPPRVLLFGDSNAAHYIPMLKAVAETTGFSFRNYAIGACPPVMGDPQPFVHAERLSDCRESLALAWTDSQAYSVLVLGGSWLDYGRRSPIFMARLEETLQLVAARGQRVVLLAKTPQLSGYDSHCREKALKLPWLNCAGLDQRFSSELQDLNQALREMADRIPGVKFFDASSQLCPEGRCKIYADDNTPRYFDASHLTVKASHELGLAVLQQDAGAVSEMFAP